MQSSNVAGLARGNYEELMRVVKNRRAIRLYKYRPVPEEDIQKIIEAGRWAPSGGNTQPWSFLVVRDKDKIARVAESFVERRKQTKEEHAVKAREFASRGEPFPSYNHKAFANAGAFILVMGDSRYTRYFPTTSQVAHIPRFKEKIKKAAETGDYDALLYYDPIIPRGGVEIWLSSMAAAVQNMFLAAWTLGYGTTWGTVSAEQDLFFKELFHIPEHYEVMTVLPLGEPGESFDGLRYRKNLKMWVHNDEFDKSKDLTNEQVDEFIYTIRKWRFRPGGPLPEVPERVKEWA